MSDIEQRISHLETQSKRFKSHLESEQRVYNQHGERLTEQGITLKVISTQIDEVKVKITALDSLLRDGNGLTVRLDRLEQQQKGDRMRGEKWVAVTAVLIAMISVIIQFVKA